MLKQYAKSFSLKETVELTSAKFGCKKASLYTDWARRPTWIKEVCDFQDADTHIRALVSSFPSLLTHLDDLIENADNSNCKLGAIKLSIETRFRMIELLKDLKAQEREEIRMEEVKRMFPGPFDDRVLALLNS